MDGASSDLVVDRREKNKRKTLSSFEMGEAQIKSTNKEVEISGSNSQV